MTVPLAPTSDQSF